MKHNKVAVSANVLEGLEAVRLSGKTNMFDVPMVVNLASEMGFPKTVVWVCENRNLYCQGLLRGFEPEDNHSAGEGGEESCADRQG